MLKIETKLLVTTNNKLLKVMLGIIVSSAIVGIFVPASVLMFILFSWKTQCILLLTLMLLFHHNDETLYALTIGIFYISPLVSYVYFNVANAPVLIGLSLSVILITICINYLVMHENYSLETMTKATALSRHGKSNLILFFILWVGLFIYWMVLLYFPSLNFVITKTAAITALLTMSLTWLAIQMIYLRALNILFDGNNKAPSVAAMSIFADPLNILMKKNNLTNNVVTRLGRLIWSVITQVFQIPTSVFYYFRLVYYTIIVKKTYNGLDHVPDAIKIAYPEICLAAVQEDDLDLKYVPKEVQLAHKEIPFAAVQEDGWDLKYVPKEVQLSYKEIPVTAVQRRPDSLKHVPEEFKTKEMCLYAVKMIDWILEHVPEKLQLDYPDIPLTAIRKNPIHLNYVPEKVQLSHPKISLAALKIVFVKYNNYYMAINLVYGCVSAALKTNVEALAKLYTGIEEHLISDLKLLGVTTGVICRVFNHLSCEIARESLSNSIPEVLLGILQKYITPESKDDALFSHPAPYLYDIKQSDWKHQDLKDVPEKVQLSHPEIPLAAVQKDGWALQFVPDAVQLAHPAIPVAAVKRNRWGPDLVSASLKTNVEALAKLYKDSEKQLRSDLELLKINPKITEKVVCYLKAKIMIEQILYNREDSKQIEQLIDNDSKKPAANNLKRRDNSSATLLPIIKGYVYTPPDPALLPMIEGYTPPPAALLPDLPVIKRYFYAPPSNDKKESKVFTP